MIAIVTLGGQQVNVDQNHINLIAGPYPHDVGPHTYVYGVTHGVLVTAENVLSLVSRLGMMPPLAQLTRPNLTPVWVKGAAVTSIRDPLPTEIPALGAVRSVINVGQLHQALREDVPTARAIINSLGGNI